MPLIFVHLSDIHFGQEKGGGHKKVHDDVRDLLVEDARDYITSHLAECADGVIISGDIAYAGKPHQYSAAGSWLDRLTAAIGCEMTAVQVVPGNHDIDREQITPAVQAIIDKIIDLGDDELDKYMDCEEDRGYLYKQFEAYQKFAEAYNCPLDPESALAGQRTYTLSERKQLKFYGVNTALICSNSRKEEGGLLLGKRQRVLPMAEPDVELVVVAHHPLHWLQDSEDAKRYLRNRARVFISGHEHTPAYAVDEVNESTEILMISSGATVPDRVDETYNYCYNILVFDLNDDDHSLRVQIHARCWQDERKAFGPDVSFDPNGVKTHSLKSPNFARQGIKKTDEKTPSIETVSEISSSLTLHKEIDIVQDKEYELVLLKFFRDLTGEQRLSILVKLDGLPTDWVGPLKHNLQRQLLDELVEKGKLQEINDEINNLLY